MSMWFRKHKILNRLREWITRPLLFILSIVWKDFNTGFGYQKKESIFVLINHVRHQLAWERGWRGRRTMRGSSYTIKPLDDTKPVWWDRLQNRRLKLETIVEDWSHPDHEDDDEKSIDAQAMDHAMAFAATLIGYNYPYMFIYHGGEPRLIWYNLKVGSKRGFDEQVALLFRANGYVNYVIFRDDEIDTNDPVTSISGYMHLDLVMDFVKTVGVEHVMKEDTAGDQAG